MKRPNSLSSRLKLLTLLWVTAAVGSIVLTLLLSWRLEGGAAAINDAWRNPALREQLIKDGRVRAAQFTWARAAQAWREIFLKEL